MVNVFKQFFHLKNYWFMVPIIGFIPWLGMLITMLICWAAQGHPLYPFNSGYQYPVYISYIGATNLRPLFISCAGWQGLFYTITLLVEYFLRKTGRLQYWFKKDERNLLFAACILGIIGSLGILFVAIFSIKNYDNVHHAMLGVFLAFICLSIICLCAQYCMMGLHYRNIHVHHKYWNKFTISFYLKVFFVVAAIIFAICFGAVSNRSVSSCFEWTLAFWYIVIFLIFAWDLFPAAKRRHKNAPYIRDWDKYDYYMYNKNYGQHPYEKYANFTTDNNGQFTSHEGQDTLVHQTSSSTSLARHNNAQFAANGGEPAGYRETNRDFTDEELQQYPLTNDRETYPIPHGQQVPVYGAEGEDTTPGPHNQQEVADAYNDGTKDPTGKKSCIIV